MHSGGWVGLRLRAGLAIGLAACGLPDPGEGTGRSTSALEVGAEIEIQPADLGLAPDSQVGPLLLRDGDGYLIAWADGRARFGMPVPDPVIGESYATRLAPDGTVLDPTGFPLPPQGALSPLAAGCTGAGTCLFVAVDQLDGGTRRITGVRVTGNQVIDAEPLMVLAGEGILIGPSVAWDGGAFRLMWSDAGGGSFTGRVDLEGQLDQVVPVDGASPGAPGAVACEGPRCLIAYRVVVPGDQGHLAGRLVDATGAVGDEFVIADGPGDDLASAPHWDGVRYWIAVTDRPPSPFNNRQISVVRIDADGQVVPPGLIEVLPYDTFNHPDPAVIHHDGDSAVLVWGQATQNGTRSMRAARVADDGTVLDPGGVRILDMPIEQGVPLVPALSCEPGQCTVVYTQARGPDLSQRGVRLQGVTELDPGGFDVATSPAGQAEAAAAYGAGRYIAVWRDSRVSPEQFRVSTIRGMLFTPAMDDVAPILTSPAPIEFPPASCPEQVEPAVAASATSYLVVWREGCQFYRDDVFAQAMGADGQPLGPSFDVGNQARRDTHPSVASSGDQFLVAWEYEEPVLPRSVQARRYGAGGAPLGERFMLTRNGLAPMAAFDGTNYLVVWLRPQSASDSRRNIFAARMAPDGTVLDTPEIAVTQLPIVQEDRHSVACGGGVCLVVWRAGLTQLRGARIAPDGALLDPAGFLVSAVDASVAATSVAFDGQAFAIVWHAESGEMLGAQVMPDGTVVPPGAFMVAAADATAFNPAVVSSGAGHLLAFYDRFDPSPSFRVRRVRARVLGAAAGPPDAGPEPEIDAAPADAGPDAGMSDGAVPDASPGDASPADASEPDPQPAPTPEDGGGCAVGGRADTLAGLLLLAMLATTRRRRRPTSSM